MTLSVATENESAATESGATDASRSRDSSVLAHCRQPRSGTDEPSAHPWHQIAIGSCMLGTHFQVKAGVEKARAKRGTQIPCFAGLDSSDPAPVKTGGRNDGKSLQIRYRTCEMEY